MTAAEIIGLSGGDLVVVLLSIIKVSPLEISVWHWLFRQFGKWINGETNDSIKNMRTEFIERQDAIEKKLDDHLEEEDRKDMVYYRKQILKFADEMYMGKYHSKEHFEEILEIMKVYNQYCEDHPDFMNDRTEIAQGLIRDQYAECMKRNSFDLHNKEIV